MAVSFQAEGHRYTSDSGDNYISVTTLIGLYKAPFDGEYWSTYKAVKLVLERKGTWSKFKSRAGGWDKVVEYYNSLEDFVFKDEISVAKQKFLDSWYESGKIAREKGSEYHNRMEELSHSVGVENKNGKGVKVYGDVDLLALIDFTKDGAYTELLIYNDHFKLAGMADKVIKIGKTVHIHDYKTSREIEMQSFQDQMMKHPVHNLPSCNYYEYSLQLSLYAWMLEQKGYNVGDLVIEHVPDNHRHYKVDYLRREVEMLLSSYGKSQGFAPYGFRQLPQEGKGKSFVYPVPKFGEGGTDFSIVFE